MQVSFASGYWDTQKYQCLYVPQVFLKIPGKAARVVPTDLLRPARHQQPHVAFSEQAGFCSLLIWNGSRVKFWPILYPRRAPGRSYSRLKRGSCIPEITPVPSAQGTNWAPSEQCVYSKQVHQLYFFSQDLRKLLLASKKTLQGYFKGRQEL